MCIRNSIFSGKNNGAEGVFQRHGTLRIRLLWTEETTMTCAPSKSPGIVRSIHRHEEQALRKTSAKRGTRSAEHGQTRKKRRPASNRPKTHHEDYEVDEEYRPEDGDVENAKEGHAERHQKTFLRGQPELELWQASAEWPARESTLTRRNEKRDSSLEHRQLASVAWTT